MTSSNHVLCEGDFWYSSFKYYFNDYLITKIVLNSFCDNLLPDELAHRAQLFIRQKVIFCLIVPCTFYNLRIIYRRLEAGTNFSFATYGTIYIVFHIFTSTTMVFIFILYAHICPVVPLVNCSESGPLWTFFSLVRVENQLGRTYFMFYNRVIYTLGNIFAFTTELEMINSSKLETQ